MLIRELFVSDVTRDIPPVVYFHEQSPGEARRRGLASTSSPAAGPRSHPHHRRVPNGIHEQYVRLLARHRRRARQAGRPELPASWISGFYGSGKSSFAKLLGLALDGVALPDGTSAGRGAARPRHLAAAPASCATPGRRCAARSTRSPWSSTSARVARDNEHIHSAVRPPGAARASATAPPSRWSPSSSSSSSATAAGRISRPGPRRCSASRGPTPSRTSWPRRTSR